MTASITFGRCGRCGAHVCGGAIIAAGIAYHSHCVQLAPIVAATDHTLCVAQIDAAEQRGREQAEARIAELEGLLELAESALACSGCAEDSSCALHDVDGVRPAEQIRAALAKGGK